MYVTLLSSTCFGPWHAHPQEEQLHKHSIWYPRSSKRLYTTPLSTGVVYSRLEERGYQMLCLCSCSSWRWACQGPKLVEDSSVTYMFILNCALKLVEEIILYYDARSKKHQITNSFYIPSKHFPLHMNSSHITMCEIFSIIPLLRFQNCGRTSIGIQKILECFRKETG